MLWKPVILVWLCGVLGEAPDAIIAQVSGAETTAVLPPGLTATDLAGIRSAHEDARHAVRSVADGHSARNQGQGWQTDFDGRGFTTRPDAAGWTWGLELSAYGFAGSELRVTRPARVDAEGRRVAYHWDDELTEWYVNDCRGLEHGYTVHHRPSRRGEGGPVPGPLMFVLAVRGGLTAEVSGAGRDVGFRTAVGGLALTYSGLTVVDADGHTVPARFECVEDGLLLTVQERGARYPLTIDPIAQQAYVKAQNSNTKDQFGEVVAVSGTTVVVGASQEDGSSKGVNGIINNLALSAGAAYVFEKSGSSWIQTAYLKASNTDIGDMFGWSVAAHDDTIVIGAIWESSKATGVNGNQFDNSVTRAGAAYVFVRSGATWSQQAYLKSSNPDPWDLFGAMVAISGDTIIVAAPSEDSLATGVDGDQSNNGGVSPGAAYVFARTGTTWTQQAYLKASNTDWYDSFGGSVTVMDDDTVVVGAPGERSKATGINGDQWDNSLGQAGAAYAFVRNGSTWSQQAYIKPSNTGSFDSFALSMSSSENTVVIGAPFEDSAATGANGNQHDESATQSGAVYVFVRDETSWQQQTYLKASNTGTLDEFGRALGLSGDTLVVGAPRESSAAVGVNGDESDDSAPAAGAAYVFMRSGTSWNQMAYLKASNTETFDLFGDAVAVSSQLAVAGAWRESSDANGPLGDQSDNSAQWAGAAYAFDIPPAECFLVVGDVPGESDFLELDHLFQTQLGPTVQDSYVVLLDAIPEFVLPGPVFGSALTGAGGRWVRVVRGEPA